MESPNRARLNCRSIGGLSVNQGLPGDLICWAGPLVVGIINPATRDHPPVGPLDCISETTVLTTQLAQPFPQD